MADVTSEGRRVGLPDLDVAVLSACLGLGLFASRPQLKAAHVLAHIVASDICGEADAWAVLRRMQAIWLLPMPLINGNGNFGTLYDEAASPSFVDCGLSNAGQLAAQSALGDLPPLPVGVINGDFHLVLGVDFALWPTDVGHPPIHLRPGLDPGRATDALLELLERPSISDDELIDLIGPPWLGPFDTSTSDFSQLLATGTQSITMSPMQDTTADNGWASPASTVLELGNSAAGVLRQWTQTWVSEIARTSEALNLLAKVLKPGGIAPSPNRAPGPPNNS